MAPVSTLHVVLVATLTAGLTGWSLAMSPGRAECPFAGTRVHGIDLSRAEAELTAQEQSLPQFGVGGSIGKLLEQVHNMSEEERWLQGDISADFGLLHRSSPPTTFAPSESDSEGSAYHRPWDEAIAALPGLIDRNTVVTYLRDDLPVLRAEDCNGSDLLGCLPDRFLPYSMMLLSYLRQAFIYTRSTVHGDRGGGDGPSDVDHSIPVPDAIEKPLATVARRLGRRSTEFTWADMFTNNVRCLNDAQTHTSAVHMRLSEALGCKLGTALVASFGKPEGQDGACESVFVGITNTQHRYFGKAVHVMAGVYEIIGSTTPDGIGIAELEALSAYFNTLKDVLMRMGAEFDVMTLNECPAKLWWDEVGVWAQAPPGEYGPNGLQFVPVLAFDGFLRRTYRYSRLGKAQADNIGALPRNHRALLRAIQSGPSLPDFITGLRDILFDLDQEMMNKFGRLKHGHGGHYYNPHIFPDTGRGKALFEAIDGFNAIGAHFKEYLSKHNSKAMAYIQGGTLKGKPRGTSGNSGRREQGTQRIIDHSGSGAGPWNQQDSDAMEHVAQNMLEHFSDEGPESRVHEWQVKCGDHGMTKTARQLSAVLYESLEERRGMMVPYNIAIFFKSTTIHRSPSGDRMFEVAGSFLPHHKYMRDRIRHGMVVNIQPSMEKNFLGLTGQLFEAWSRTPLSELDQVKWGSAISANLGLEYFNSITNPQECRLTEADVAMSLEYRPLGENTLKKLKDAFLLNGELDCVEALSNIRPEFDWGDVMEGLPAQCKGSGALLPSEVSQPLKSRKYSVVTGNDNDADFTLFVKEVRYSIKESKSPSTEKRGLVSLQVAPADEEKLSVKMGVLQLDPHSPFLSGPFAHYLLNHRFEDVPDYGSDGPWYAAKHRNRRRIAVVTSGTLWNLMDPIVTRIENHSDYEAVRVVMARNLDDIVDHVRLCDTFLLESMTNDKYKERLHLVIAFTKLKEGTDDCIRAREYLDQRLRIISVLCRKQGIPVSYRGFKAIDFNPLLGEDGEEYPENRALDVLRRILRPRYLSLSSLESATGHEDGMDGWCYPDEYRDTVHSTTLEAWSDHLGLGGQHRTWKDSLEGLAVWSPESTDFIMDYMKRTARWQHPTVMSIGSRAFGVSLHEFTQDLVSDCFSGSREEKNFEARQYIQMLKRLGYWVEETNGGSPVTEISFQATCSDMEKLNQANDKQCVVSHLGNMYDISGYVNSGSHPGGSMPLRAFCGKDMTEAFGVTGHSISAHQELAAMKIASLVDEADSLTAEQKLPVDEILKDIPRSTNPCAVEILTGHGFVMTSTGPLEAIRELSSMRARCSEDEPEQVLVVGPVGIYVAWARGSDGSDEKVIHRVTIPFPAMGKNSLLSDDSDCLLIEFDGSPTLRVLVFCKDRGNNPEDATAERFLAATNACLGESQWLDSRSIQERNNIIQWQLAVHYDVSRGGEWIRSTIPPSI